jgi:hypothetical protein
VVASLLVVAAGLEENHSFEQIIGSPAAPFRNRLAAHGALLTDDHAITHPWLPNDVALLSGQTSRHSDCRACTVAGPTLVEELEASLVWRTDTRLVVTFDEGTRRDVRACCGGLGGGGRIPTIVGPEIPHGQDAAPDTHSSRLGSVEAGCGLGLLGHAGDPASAAIAALADPTPRTR